MGKITDARFKGKTGTYDFGVYTTDTVFIDVGAVYIFSKRVVGSDGRGTHTFLTKELATFLKTSPNRRMRIQTFCSINFRCSSERMEKVMLMILLRL